MTLSVPHDTSCGSARAPSPGWQLGSWFAAGWGRGRGDLFSPPLAPGGRFPCASLAWARHGQPQALLRRSVSLPAPVLGCPLVTCNPPSLPLPLPHSPQTNLSRPRSNATSAPPAPAPIFWMAEQRAPGGWAGFHYGHSQTSHAPPAPGARPEAGLGQPVASTSAAPYQDSPLNPPEHAHLYHNGPDPTHQQHYDPSHAAAYPTVAEQRGAPPLLAYDSTGRFRLPPAWDAASQAQGGAGAARDVHNGEGPVATLPLPQSHNQHPHLGHAHAYATQQHAAYHYWPTQAPPAPPPPQPQTQHDTAGGWAGDERRFGDEPQAQAQGARGEDRYGQFGDHSYRERLAASRLSGYTWDWQRHHHSPPQPPPQMPGYPPHSGAPTPPPTAHRESVLSLKRPLNDDVPLPRSLSVPDARSHLSRASSIWGPSAAPVAPPAKARPTPAQPLNLPKIGPLTTHSPLIVPPLTPPLPSALHAAAAHLSRSLSPSSRVSDSASPPEPAQPDSGAHVTDPRAREPVPTTSSESEDDDAGSAGTGDGSRKRRKRRRRLTETPRDVANRKFGCATCGKMFARPSALATHERSHSKEKPHCCPIESCARAFAVSSNLRRHQTIYDHWSSAEEKALFEKRSKGVARADSVKGVVKGRANGAAEVDGDGSAAE